jgi:hypothetical protein
MNAAEWQQQPISPSHDRENQTQAEQRIDAASFRRFLNRAATQLEHDLSEELTRRTRTPSREV